MDHSSSEALWKELDQVNGIRVDTAISINSKDPVSPYPNQIQSPQTKWSLTIITISLALGTFLVALDTMIIGIAVPSITSEFKSLDAIAWYGSAYLLTTTALQPSFGKLYTQYNAKTIYLCCVAVFESGSVICAAAQTSDVFIFGRALAGCGAAGLFQGALNIITATVPLAKRPLYLSAVISVFGISICVGPVLGGAFTQNVSWRWCFWINLPIGAVTFVLIMLFLKIENKRTPMSLKARIMQLDPLGAVMLLASVVCLLLALQWGGQAHAWNSATIIGLLIGFGLLFIIFGFIQWKMGEDATIPLRVLKQRSILSASAFLFFIAMSNYVYGYYIPIYFQSIKGSSATKSGLEFMALALPQIMFVILSGAVVTQWGYYVPYMIVGSVICAVGSGLLTTIDTTSPTLKWAAYMVVTGIGTGICVNLPYTAVQVVLHEADVPTGNAIAQFSFQLGASISLSIGQSLFLNKLTSQVAQNTPLSPAAVVAAGAYDLPGLARAAAASLRGDTANEILRVLRNAYSASVKDTLIYALASVCIAVLCTLGMEHRNVKKAAREREEAAGVANSSDSDDASEKGEAGSRDSLERA